MLRSSVGCVGGRGGKCHRLSLHIRCYHRRVLSIRRRGVWWVGGESPYHWGRIVAPAAGITAKYELSGVDRPDQNKQMFRNTVATARTTARFYIHDAHSTQQQAAAARGTPSSKCCCRLSSALLHSANRVETLPEQELKLEASMLKRALLVAYKVRFHRGSALERRSLYRCEALYGLFRTRTTAPKWVRE